MMKKVYILTSLMIFSAQVFAEDTKLSKSLIVEYDLGIQAKAKK